LKTTRCLDARPVAELGVVSARQTACGRRRAFDGRALPSRRPASDLRSGSHAYGTCIAAGKTAPGGHQYWGVTQHLMPAFAQTGIYGPVPQRPSRRAAEFWRKMPRSNARSRYLPGRNRRPGLRPDPSPTPSFSAPANGGSKPPLIGITSLPASIPIVRRASVVAEGRPAIRFPAPGCRRCAGSCAGKDFRGHWNRARADL
jgi:hypothetical protein